MTKANPNLRRLVSQALVREGYERVDRMHKLHLVGGFSFIVDTGPIGSRGDIAPWAGLRHDAVQDLVVDLLELERDDFSATVGANVGYIIDGEYRTWTDVSEVGQVLEALEAAREALARYTDLALLPRIWEIIGTQAPGYHYKLVAIHLLLNDEMGVERWLREGERLDCKFDDELCEQFRRFERNVKAVRTRPR